MGWESRRKKRYYYRSVRINGRPRKVYLGGGAVGEAHARLDARDRQQRALARLSVKTEHARLASADAALDDLKAAARLMARAKLLTVGAGSLTGHGGWGNVVAWEAFRGRPEPAVHSSGEGMAAGSRGRDNWGHPGDRVSSQSVTS